MTMDPRRANNTKQSTTVAHRARTRGAEQILIAASLGLILALGAFLRFYKLGAFSIGNTYYAATVKSMLTSWHNFFFAAFEPGGSVSVDKPPLGFWIQAVSAYFLGVNGFALALPQALAGVFSIPLLYSIVKSQFNVLAGLVAALALAIMPVTIATERNNTIDGLLVFVLLLAAWAFIKSVRSGHARYLFLGVFLVGLGFNIKMLQAFMPLPAFYLVYLLGARHRWWVRIFHLAGASVLLIVVSLSWAIVVDLTPPEERPYVGSSEDNTVMELIVGHNGLSRLIAKRHTAPPRDDGPASPPPFDGQPRPMYGSPPLLQTDDQQNPAPRMQITRPPALMSQPGSSGGFSNEIGEAGVLRLFTAPLADEASWLLPTGLLGLMLTIVMLGWKWPLQEEHLALLMWGGWLIPAMLYFTFTTGLYHAYYLIMLGPPLAALIGVTAWSAVRLHRVRRWLGWIAIALLMAITLTFQIAILAMVQVRAPFMLAAALFTGVLGVGLLLFRHGTRLNQLAFLLIGIAIILLPLYWACQTTFNQAANAGLPDAGPARKEIQRPVVASILSPIQQRILGLLLDVAPEDGYLLAATRANEVAPYILATDRPALALGGFTGGDPVIDVETLAAMVSGDELRFILGGESLAKQKPEIAVWVEETCQVVPFSGQHPAAMRTNPRPGSPIEAQGILLYDCGVDKRRDR